MSTGLQLTHAQPLPGSVLAAVTVVPISSSVRYQTSGAPPHKGTTLGRREGCLYNVWDEAVLLLGFPCHCREHLQKVVFELFWADVV